MGNRKLISKRFYFFIFLISSAVVGFLFGVYTVVDVMLYASFSIIHLLNIVLYGLTGLAYGAIPILVTALILYPLKIRVKSKKSMALWLVISSIIGGLVFGLMLRLLIDEPDFLLWLVGSGSVSALLASLTIVLIERRINRNMAE